MKAIKGLPEHTFVTIVGIAAFIHSTWTVATFSGGVAPEVIGGEPGKLILTILSWLWWVLPGALAAFALEVGQVVTARQIQRGVGRRLTLIRWSMNVKTLTFVILSAATYLLQLAYLLHHYPLSPISAGIPVDDVPAANMVMRIIIWGMPLLLPISMLLFTAGDEVHLPDQPERRIAALVPVPISCPDCDWQGEYSDPIAAQNALNGHMRRHSLIQMSSSNGRH